MAQEEYSLCLFQKQKWRPVISLKPHSHLWEGSPGELCMAAALQSTSKSLWFSQDPMAGYLHFGQQWMNFLPFCLNLQDRRRGFKYLPGYYNFLNYLTLPSPGSPRGSHLWWGHWSWLELSVCLAWNSLTVPLTTSFWAPTAPQSCNPTFSKLIICQYFDVC